MGGVIVQVFGFARLSVWVLSLYAAVAPRHAGPPWSHAQRECETTMNDQTTTLKRVLLTTDLSEASERAFPVAAAIADAVGASITVLHALDLEPQLPPGALSLSPRAQEEFRQEVRALVQTRLTELTGKYLSDVSHVDTDIIEGHGAAHLICDHAQDGGFDLIVISTHGRTALGRMLIGSTAEKVMRGAHCPVVSVPPK